MYSRSSFLVKGSTSSLERCGGVMHSEHHKRLTLRSGCSMHTKRHKRLLLKMRRHTTHRAPQRLTLFSRVRTTKAGTRSTMGHLRAVTKPVQAWGNLHNLIGGSQVIATKAPPRHHQDHKPSRVPRTREVQAPGTSSGSNKLRVPRTQE